MHRPKVNVLLERDQKILFLKRSNTSCYSGYWCLPGGKIEKGESPTIAAQRETLEEVGLDIKPDFVATAYAKVPLFGKDDYEDLVFLFKGEALQDPQNCEPEKHSQLQWFSLDDLPAPLIPSAKLGIDLYLQDKVYGELGY